MTLLSGFLIFCVGYLCGALVTRNADLQRRQERIEALRKAAAAKPEIQPVTEKVIQYFN